MAYLDGSEHKYVVLSNKKKYRTIWSVLRDFDQDNKLRVVDGTDVRAKQEALSAMKNAALVFNMFESPPTRGQNFYKKCAKFLIGKGLV